MLCGGDIVFKLLSVFLLIILWFGEGEMAEELPVLVIFELLRW